MKKLLLIVALLVGSVAAKAQDAQPKTQIVLADGTWTVLREAARSSMQVDLELGGCAKLVLMEDNKYLVDSAYVSFRRLARTSITMRCNIDEVIWHTHMQLWMSEKYRCSAEAMRTDVKNIGPHPLGLVVCGLTLDKVRPYVSQGGVQK